MVSCWLAFKSNPKGVLLKNTTPFCSFHRDEARRRFALAPVATGRPATAASETSGVGAFDLGSSGKELATFSAGDSPRHLPQGESHPMSSILGPPVERLE